MRFACGTVAVGPLDPTRPLRPHRPGRGHHRGHFRPRLGHRANTCRRRATLEIVARNEAKAIQVCERLRADGAPGGADFVIADTGDLDAIRRVAVELAERHGRVDALIHSAGALDATYARSPQAIEHTVASQVVGPFLLTEMLVPLLRKATRARVLWVSSGGMYTEPLSVDKLEMGPDGYNGTTAYARAKRAQVTLAEMWADRLRTDHIAVHSMHPGWTDTPGVERSLPTFRRVVGPLLRSPSAGADTILWLTADDGEPIEDDGPLLARSPTPADPPAPLHPPVRHRGRAATSVGLVCRARVTAFQPALTWLFSRAPLCAARDPTSPALGVGPVDSPVRRAGGIPTSPALGVGPVDCSTDLQIEGPRPKSGRGPSICGAGGNRTRVL
ncbi:MAG: SDR family NAD(P)-dependent oxidoreductase [Aeromicrobium sp.]